MSRFIDINEAIELPLLSNNDILMRDKGKFLKFAKHVYRDLNLTAMKMARREEFKINKRTNSIDLPCEFDKVASVSIRDECGIFHPVWQNPKLTDDVVDVSSSKDCACEFKCGYKNCNTIKGYEAVVSTKSDYLPNGDPISFTCVDRKAVDDQGFFYEQTQYPLRQYVSGVWIDTVLHTENTKLCQVEVDENGCVCDTESNCEALCNTCCTGVSNFGTIPIGGNAQSFCNNDAVNTWMFYCNSRMDWFGIQCGCFTNLRACNNIYNISELGDRLIFPANFGWDKVMVRYYVDPNLKNMQIPVIALDAFISGLKWWAVRWNDKMQNLASKYEADYTKQQWGLLLELNKYTIKELRMIATPPVYMPSFVPNRTYPTNGYW